MRCTKCDYRLWNLAVRDCPECGQAFKPSDFDFVPNKVKYACPDCGQDYYGTDARGHLSPKQFQCVKCDRALDMDDMLLTPAEGVTEDQTRPDQNPWTDRASIGRVKAWFRTVGRGFVGSGKLLRVTAVDSSVGQAWWFLTTIALIVGAAYLLGQFLCLGVMSMSTRGGGPPPGQMLLAGGGMGLVGMAVNIVLTLLGVLFWGATTHGLLHVGRDKPTHTMGRTYQAVCYSSGPYLINMATVACLGSIAFPIASIWWIVSAIFAVRDAQRVSGGKATLAVLAFPVFVVLLMVGAITIFIVQISSAGGGGFPAPPTALTSTDIASQAAKKIVGYANSHDGSPPDHALRLVVTGAMTAQDFASPYTMTDVAMIPAGDSTAELLAFSDSATAHKQVDAEAALLPKDVVAHRVGDLVFTYHGMDFDEYDGRLWIVIYWPDPDVNTLASTELIEMSQADGVSVTVLRSAFDEKLDEQNALRKDAGLPALPHPSTVTHEEPGVGSVKDEG